MHRDQASPPAGQGALERQRVQRELRARMFGAQAEPVRIDRFEIRRRLGAGAMGVVYAAYDPRLTREVAIKLMKQATLRDPNHFHHEARALARLSHPFVLQVHEAGVHEGAPYLVSEFVAGGTLREWLAATGRPRPWREVLAVLLDTGKGLLAAHQRGLVHRDVKPDNVLVGADGRPRVSDFGLASVPDPGALFAAGQGGMVGTLRYMAPEQLRGEGADAQSDQFGFCVMAFEALFEKLPFDGSSPEAWLTSISAGSIGEAPRGPAAALWPVLQRGLSARPAGRYQSMSELLTDLERAAGQRRRRFALAGAALGLVSIGLALAASFQLRSPAAFASDAEASSYKAAVGLMYKQDFKGCVRLLAPYPRSEPLNRLRAECLFKLRDTQELTRLCAGWTGTHPGVPSPPSCDDATLRALGFLEQRRYRECVETIERADSSASHNLLMSDCVARWSTPEGYFRQCVWTQKYNPNTRTDCRKPTNL